MNTKHLRFTILALSSLAAPLAQPALTRIIAVPGNGSFSATAISGDGTTLVVAGSFDPGGWIWRESTGFVQLPNARYPSHGGISYDGSLVIGSFPGAGAFRLNTVSNEFENPPVNSPDTSALALSEDGTKVLLSTSQGVYLWSGDSQIQISTLAAVGGSISNDGRAAIFVVSSGFGTYLWTQAGGLQQLSSAGYVRHSLLSANGALAVVHEYDSTLGFWEIGPSGIATLIKTERTRTAWITGASPDCSIIGLFGSYSPTAWTAETGYSTIEDILATRGATLPHHANFAYLCGTSSSAQTLAGSLDAYTPSGWFTPHIWLVDLNRSCPAEFTFDARVDDEDFVQFCVAYAATICPDPEWDGPCPADLNHDGFVDDSDFEIFAVAYDNLTCP